MNNNEKIWRKITYPGVKPNMYLISEDGEVMNILTLKILKAYSDKDGYYKISLLSSEKRIKGVFIHRLVAYQFCDNPNNYPVVDHLDGVKTHNHYSNLEWVTIRENTLRAERMGLRKVKGEDNGHSKYTEEFARSICEKYELGWDIRDVFRWITNNPKAKYRDNTALYGFIYSLKKKTIWPHVVEEYTYSTENKEYGSWNDPVPQSSNFVYSEEYIRQICSYLEQGFTVMDIIEKLSGVRNSNTPLYDLINGIRRGRNWTNISCEYNIDLNKTKDRKSGWYEDIPRLVDAGMKTKDIMRYYKIGYKKDNPTAYYAIERMIRRYKKFKKLSTNESIVVISDDNDE